GRLCRPEYPPVAQLDNAADSDSEERGFESLQARFSVFFSFPTPIHLFTLKLIYECKQFTEVNCKKT
ncbi:MAG TPA: hypothetical protein O0X34_01145, partial [Methanocorpusculum sp.]|nr:hypothetical protein [Methanocorpusculum sp.]